MCAVHDGGCSPWVMCSVVSGNRIHDNYAVATPDKGSKPKKEREL